MPLIDGGTVRLPRLIGHSRALDMILTGRPVGAEEALHWGLANQVVADGTARAATEALATQIAAFPKLCLRADRLSSYEQWSLPQAEAIFNESRRGRSEAARRWRAPRISAMEKGATAVLTDPRPHGQ